MNSQNESERRKDTDKNLNCLKITLHKQRHTKEAPDIICKVTDLRG